MHRLCTELCRAFYSRLALCDDDRHDNFNRRSFFCTSPDWQESSTAPCWPNLVYLHFMSTNTKWQLVTELDVPKSRPPHALFPCSSHHTINSCIKRKYIEDISTFLLLLCPKFRFYHSLMTAAAVFSTREGQYLFTHFQYNDRASSNE